MFESLDKVDWDLLHQQKLSLLAIRAKQRSGSPDKEILSGIMHLLDALQDDAVADYRWAFPNHDEPKGCA